MEQQGEYAWKSCEELGVGLDVEKAIAESIRAKVRHQKLLLANPHQALCTSNVPCLEK